MFKAAALGAFLIGTDAACNFTELKAGDSCTMAWSDLDKILRPTQEAVGYAWVQRKLDKDFSSAKDAQKEMSTPTPVILGPGAIPYAIDDHHTLSALEASGFSSTTVTLDVVCDWSMYSMDEFYQKLVDAKFLYNLGRPEGDQNTLPTVIDFATMPKSIATLKDDPWRAVTSFVRKIRDDSCPSGNKYCMRGFERDCDPNTGGTIPFFEFRWAYFINDSFNNTLLWDDQSDYKDFIHIYDAQPYPSVPGETDITPWEDMAVVLNNLCRGTEAGKYLLPSTAGSISNEPLPGYVGGMDPIPTEDPDCASPTCPADTAAPFKLAQA